MRLRGTFLAMTTAAVCLGVIEVTPPVVDTGVSNVTAFFAVSTTSQTAVAWSAQGHYGGAPELPAWFSLQDTNGTVSATGDNCVSLKILRGQLPAIGTYTGSVEVTGGGLTKTVTVVTAITSTENGMFPKIGGSGVAYAGIPYQLDARDTVGWIGSYYWITNFDNGQTVEAQAVSTNEVDEIVFYEPGDLTLTLVAKDTHGNPTLDSRRIAVWNSPPQLDAGGPYYTHVGGTVEVVAAASDPNPNERLLYAWQFDVPDGLFTPATTSPTATFVMSSLEDVQIMCLVSDTWTGMTGSNDAPLTAQKLASVLVTNLSPSVEVSFLTNGVWTEWTTSYAYVSPLLPLTNAAMRARMSDPDGGPEELMVEWMEDPANPSRGLIGEQDRTNETLVIARLGEPGIYRFMAVAFDGRSQSKAAEMAIDIPGAMCNVTADGFQLPIPVWGTYSTPWVGNTNQYGYRDETEATRSDIDGWFYLDRAADSHSEVELTRWTGESKTFVFTPTMRPDNRLRQQVFKFPMQMLAYSLRVNNGALASVTLVRRPSVQISALCDSSGLCSFGSIPKAGPMDGDDGTYYFLVYKPGFKSLCLPTPQTSLIGSMTPVSLSLEASTNEVSLSGLVVSSLSGLPVPDALVRFGRFEAMTGNDGQFAFAALPEPFYVPNLLPTHILNVRASGYDPQIAVFYSTTTGGHVKIALNEQGQLWQGVVFDRDTTNVLREGTMETMSANGVTALTVRISSGGRFALPIPLGSTHVTIQSRGEYCVEAVPARGTAGIRSDIIFRAVPEPAAPATLLCLFLIGKRRGECLHT